VTSEADLERDLRETVERAAATGAAVFFATLPRPSVLPITSQKREQQKDVEAYDALVAEMDAHRAWANALLASLVSEHDNVHLVDVYSEVETMRKDGVIVGEDTLTVDVFGGLLTLDGVHFTDTGYALVANFFMERIDEELGTDLGQIDLEEVMASDPNGPQALMDGGVDVAACE
jgi:lysophospholipase L1-like esterase